LSADDIANLLTNAREFVSPEMLHDQNNTYIKTAIHNGTSVILKKVKDADAREVQILQHVCPHDHIATFYGRYEGPEKGVVFGMEYCIPSYGGKDAPNLYSESYCRAMNLDTKHIFASLATGIGAALVHLHTRDIVHKDVKLRNTAFVFGKDGRVVFKLIDFGNANFLSNARFAKQLKLHDASEFREMIMNVFTWEILPRRENTKRIYFSEDVWSEPIQGELEVYDILPWLKKDAILQYVLEDHARHVGESIQNERNTELLTIVVDGRPLRFVELDDSY
jgi:serine/threonine protein kinase